MRRNPRKTPLVGAALLLASLGLAACGDAGSDSSEGAPEVDVAEDAAAEFEDGTRMKELAESGEITIGVKYDQPGIGFKSATSDMPEGFDPEMGKILAALAGHRARGHHVEGDDLRQPRALPRGRRGRPRPGVVLHHRRAPRDRGSGRPLLRHRPAAARGRRLRHRDPRRRQGHRGLLGDRLHLAGEHREGGRHAARLRHLLRVRRPGRERHGRRDDHRRRDPARATRPRTPTTSRSSWSPSPRSATASATRRTPRRCASGSTTPSRPPTRTATWEDAFAATLGESGVDAPEQPELDPCEA